MSLAQWPQPREVTQGNPIMVIPGLAFTRAPKESHNMLNIDFFGSSKTPFSSIGLGRLS